MARRSGVSGGAKLRRLLQRLPDDLTGDVIKAVQDGAEIVKLEQLRRVPQHDRDLASSIEIRKGSKGLSAEIGPGARTKAAQQLAGWRAHWTEFGTRPHSTAKGASLGGGRKRTKGQRGRMHPGQPARPFIFPGLEAAAPEVRQMIDEAVDHALRRFIGGGGAIGDIGGGDE